MEDLNNFKTFLKLEKEELFTELKRLYKSPLSILENFKEDYTNLYIKFNGKKYSQSHDFLDNINKRYNDL